MEQIIPDDSYQKIINTYLDTGSIKETASKVGVSVVKVRRILITEGMWSSKTSEAIADHIASGKSISEIAQIMSTTEKAVQQYMPYTRGIYMSENRSVAALNSQDYRKRIEVVKEKILRRKSDIGYGDGYGDSSGNGNGDDNGSKNGNYTGEYMHYQKNDVADAPHKSNNVKNQEEKMEESIFEQYPGIVWGRELPEQKLNEMLRKIKMQGEDVYRLHLELIHDWVPGVGASEDSEHTDMLKKYGSVQYGNTISRDILIPGQTQLHSLHYMMQ